jgi:hypothetical protein
VSDKTAVTLTFIDGNGVSVSIPKLSPISVQTVVPREYRTTDAILWITLQDLRHRYRQVPVKRSFNLRLSSGLFDSTTLNGSTPWTWTGIVEDLWGKLRTAFPALANGTGGTAAPSFPSAPGGTPESFSFWSVSAWDALCTVVQAAGYLVRYDPIRDRVAIIDPSQAAPAEPLGVVQVRTWDTAGWTSIPEPVPASVTCSFFRIGRVDKHSISASISESGVTSGTEVVLPAYPQAAGDPVSNTAYLTAFTSRVRDFWRRDLAAMAEPRRVQCKGWQPWVQSAVGLSGYAAWSVSQLAADEVQTGAASGSLLVLDPGSFQTADGEGEDIWAEITGSATTTGTGSGVDGDRRAYSWRQRVKSQAGWWMNGVNSGTLNAYATEPAAGYFGLVPNGTMVRLWPSPTVSGAWEFLPPDSTPTGSGSGNPLRLVGTIVAGLNCRNGVLWVLLRDHFEDSNGFSSYGPARDGYTAGCCECPTSGSGGGSGSSGGTVSCCGRALPTTLTLTLSGGQGTVTLTWDGTRWTNTVTLPCGSTVIFRYDTNCGLTWSTDGGENFNGNPLNGTVNCGPPFTHTGISIGLGAPCGTLTGTVSE